MPDDDCFTSELLVRFSAQLSNEMARAMNSDKDKTFGNSSVLFKPQDDDRVNHIAMSLK
jgi:hypothetical protein